MTLNSNIIVLNENRYNGSELVRLTLGKMKSNGVYPRAKLMLETVSLSWSSVKVWDVNGVEQALACGADVAAINEKGCSSLMTVNDILGKECKDLDGLPGQNDSFKF